MEQKIALLIDAENTSVKYIDVIMKEIKQYGDITFQRIYGDFSNSKMAEWANKALDYAIVPIHQAIYTTGKNAADIMLVIDAMDILFQNNVDGFCIVSSDSDFTRLANRLREGGKLVIGMGMSCASKTFISACNEYKYLDKIIEDDLELEDSIELKDNAKMGEDVKLENESAMTPLSEIKCAINRIVQYAESKGEYANLGSTKSQIQREYADFDERNYGYTLFRKFIEEETRFQVQQNGSTAYIVRKQAVVDEKIISDYVITLAKGKMELGAVGRNIHNQFPEFKYKELGYSKLSKYISSIPQVKIEAMKGNKKYVVLNKQ